jgi:hypothetical protein
MEATNLSGSCMTGEAEKAAQEAKSWGSKVTESAKNAAGFVGEKAESCTSAVGAGMESLGDAIRQREPAQGMLHNAGEAIANKLESGGHYLEHQGLKGMGEDITNLIRRNPVPALLIGVGMGVLIARMVRR